MIFTYNARTTDGTQRAGTLEASSLDSAIRTLQHKNLVVVSINQILEEPKWYELSLKFFRVVHKRDVMILTRQLATLFEARVPVVQIFRTLLGETQELALRAPIAQMLDDVQGGMTLSQCMARQPSVFSDFYVSMVRAGEESGKLDEVFSFLADYLERNYKLLTKARSALIYPAFVIVAFIAVMILMFAFIVPRLSVILIQTGQELPIYTKIVIGLSQFFRDYGIIILVLLVGGSFFLARYLRTQKGSEALARTELALPVIGELFRKLYLARIADNLQTLITGGLPIVRSLQITADVVENAVYRGILLETVDAVRGGSPIAEALAQHREIPYLFTQMMKVGEETGKLQQILQALSRFYTQQVESFVDNLVSLIEPVLIVALGLGVGVIVASILLPIYNIAASF